VLWNCGLRVSVFSWVEIQIFISLLSNLYKRTLSSLGLPDFVLNHVIILSQQSLAIPLAASLLVADKSVIYSELVRVLQARKGRGVS